MDYNLEEQSEKSINFKTSSDEKTSRNIIKKTIFWGVVILLYLFIYFS